MLQHHTSCPAEYPEPNTSLSLHFPVTNPSLSPIAISLASEAFVISLSLSLSRAESVLHCKSLSCNSLRTRLSPGPFFPERYSPKVFSYMVDLVRMSR